MAPVKIFSKLEIIFCFFLAKNNFVNLLVRYDLLYRGEQIRYALIPFSGTYPAYRGLG